LYPETEDDTDPSHVEGLRLKTTHHRPPVA
jgi:hypothetical protein